jgi:hypothetical protein
MTHSVPYSQQSNAGEYEKQQKKVLIIDCDYIQRRVLFFLLRLLILLFCGGPTTTTTTKGKMIIKRRVRATHTTHSWKERLGITEHAESFNYPREAA